MRVISKSMLREFWQAGNHKAKVALLAWYRIVSDRSVSWSSWDDLKAQFGSADRVGDCVVFNIGGNNLRLIARVRYGSRRVYVLKVMTHAEYSKNAWKSECGCFDEPPSNQGE